MSIKKNEDISKKLKEIIYDDKKLEEIKNNIQKFANQNAAVDIIKKIFETTV